MKMLLLDKYYQIVEKKTHLVSLQWKIYHFLTLLGAVVCCFLTSYYFRKVEESFDNQCVLFSNLTFKETELCYASKGDFPYNASFHNSWTVWNTQSVCDYCEYLFLFTSIIGVIMLAFIVILPKGGGETSQAQFYTRPWRLVLPFIVLTLIITMIVFLTFVILKSGLKGFCSQFESQMNDTECSKAIDAYTLIYHEEERNASCYVKATVLFSTLSLIFWVCLLCSLLFRLFKGADFEIVVYRLENMKENHLDNLKYACDSSSSAETVTKVVTDDVQYIKNPDAQSIKSIKSITSMPLTKV